MTYRLKAAAFAAVLIPASAFAQGGFTGPGWYEITNVQSGRVIDLDSINGRTVIQFEPRGTNNQTWEIRQGTGGGYFFLNGMNGSALTALSNRNGSLLEAVPFSRTGAQEWRIESGTDGLALIVNQAYGRAIDVPNGTTRNGQRLQIFDRNSGANQRFSFRQTASGVTSGTDGIYDTDRNRRNRGNRRGQNGSVFGQNGGQSGSIFDDPQSGDVVSPGRDNSRPFTESTDGVGTVTLRGRAVDLTRSNVRINGQNAVIDFTTSTGASLRMAGRVVSRDYNEMRIELRNFDNQTSTGTAYVRFRRNNEVREITVDGTQRDNDRFNLTFTGRRY